MAIPNNSDMRFEATTKCNYNCVICPRDKITRKIETMSLKLFKQLFDKITNETDQYNTLTFPGMGEPLLDETLIKKIEYAKSKKKDLVVLILTNGSLLTLDKFKELEALGVDSVRVSFYGDDTQSYAKVHGVSNQDMFTTVRNNLLEISREKKATKLLMTFNVVDNANKLSVKKWIDFWQTRVDLLEIWRPHNWVDARSYRKVQCQKLKTCGRPLKGPLQVQVDGTVNMCCFDFDGKLTIGDLKIQTLNDIFSSKLYKKIVDCHNRGEFKDSSLICENCDLRNIDKSDVMIYNSKFDIKERVNQISTTYRSLD